MKIVDVSGFYAEAGGGVRRYVEAKFAAAAAAGHELTVIAPGAESRAEPRPGGRVVWVKSPPMPFDPRYRRFAEAREAWAIMDGAAPDVVEGSSPWRGGTIAAMWPGSAARALVFHQDVVAGYAHTAFDRWLGRRAIDALAAPWWARVRRLSARFDVTIAGGEWLAARLGAHGVRNAVALPFGVEAGRFDPARRDETLRSELLARCGAPPGATLLLAMSRFHPEKRLATVIEAVARARRTRPDLALAVIGDGLARRSVERAAAAAGRVALIGEIDDRERLAAILASGDLFVHGSGAETYGLAVAEAIASGLTVVVPDSGGAADLARRGRSVTYRTGDPADGARAILAAVNGEAERPAALPPGSMDDHFTALFALYEDLVDRRARRWSRPAR
ncbi:MAG TPA: glycosyltransferase [Caulobacteraceae bacterium]|jgi:alpha-1,6-mannosyltransferase|nr:glycosyltransferase [Caulobacteraceae bacterium]